MRVRKKDYKGDLSALKKAGYWEIGGMLPAAKDTEHVKAIGMYYKTLPFNGAQLYIYMEKPGVWAADLESSYRDRICHAASVPELLETIASGMSAAVTEDLRRTSYDDFWNGIMERAGQKEEAKGAACAQPEETHEEAAADSRPGELPSGQNEDQCQATATAQGNGAAVVIGSFAHGGFSPYEKDFISWINSQGFDKVHVLITAGAVQCTIEHPLTPAVVAASLRGAGISNLGSIDVVGSQATDEDWVIGVRTAVSGIGSESSKTVLIGNRLEGLLTEKALYPCTVNVFQPTRFYKAAEPQASQLMAGTLADAVRYGMETAAARHYPTSYQTVDVAIINPEKQVVYMCHKKPGDLPRFVGGFVDPSDKSLDHAAMRECLEETGCDVIHLEMIGTYRIDDTRYRFEKDKILTALFVGTTRDTPVPADDICEIEAVPLDRFDDIDVVPQHEKLRSAVVRYLAKDASKRAK